MHGIHKCDYSYSTAVSVFKCTEELVKLLTLASRNTEVLTIASASAQQTNGPRRWVGLESEI